MKIVITGALGQIGSALIRGLPFAFPGSEIVMIDNLQSQRYLSLANLPSQGQYRFVEADILDADLNSLFEGADAVVHLAAITHLLPACALETMNRVNVEGTQKVAETSSETGSPLIFISTTSVYGKEGIAEEENAADLNPQSPYAESKLRAERLIQEFGAGSALKFSIFRFGTVFGVSPGMQFQTAIHKFCWQALTGQPVTVWQTALRQTRPYLELKDAVRAIQFLIQRRIFHGEIYNAATTHSNAEEIIKIIQEKIPALDLHFVESALMNDWSYEVSCRRLSQKGFEFQGCLRQEIHNIISTLEPYLKSQFQNPNKSSIF